MTTLSIQPPFPILTDADGQPLENGYIWIGAANLNPQTSPITVYWDAALTQTAVQPIRTRGGYPVNAGTPARLYVGSDYSILVQNKNGSTVYSAPDGASDRFSAAQISFLQAGAGAVVRTVQGKLQDVVSVKDFGAVGDGVADDRIALNTAALAAIAAGTSLFFPAGTYRVASALTIACPMTFAPGAMLRPTTSIKVTLTSSVDAGLYQIFDRSDGGVVEFGGSRVPSVYAEWFGARGGSGGRTDNDIPIQHALDALQSIIYSDYTTPAPNDDNSGGEVVLGYSAEYLMSGRLHLRNRVRIRGQGRYSELKINNATWSGTEMVLSQNGIISQFWCRLENLSLNANENTTITRVIYAPAWQESCGLRDVLIEKFRCHGVYIDNGYGGAVGTAFKSVQFFPSSSIASDQSAIYVTIPFLTSVYNVLLDELSFAGGSTVSPPGVNLIGITAIGRVIIQCQNTHVEGFDYGVNLNTDASLYGVLGATGNPSVAALIACSSGWTGRIDSPRANIGGATYLVRSFASGNTRIYELEPIFGRISYPHTPSEILGYTTNTTAGGTLSTTAYGFSGITRSGAGQYRLSFNALKFAPAAGTSYKVRVDCQNTSGGRTYYVAGQTATYVDLVFKDASGANADCDTFDVFLYGRPGV